MDINLNHIIENSEYISKLATSLDSNKECVRKQVFDLLITLCTYHDHNSGFLRAIEILEHYKKLKRERYRFKFVISELENTLKLEYKVTLLKFVNCLIVSAGSVAKRICVRNEYISLGFLPVLNDLRKLSTNVPDICLQLKVFDDQRECDESQSLQGIDEKMNENCQLELFYTIYRHVQETQNENNFLHILQDFSKIEAKESMKDCIWSTLATVIQRTIALENESDAEKMLRSASVQKISCPHCRSDINSSRKFSIPFTSTSPITPIALPPPPPPMIHQNTSKMPPPPPPPIPNSKSNLTNDAKVINKPPETNFESSLKTLPQQETPIPRSKMKTINWNKIPQNKVIGQNNIWSIVANNHQNTPLTEINWEEMEGLFCQQQQLTQSSPKPGKEISNNTFEMRSKKENEIVLLDGKRSLNVNIFLKQFRSSNEEIIRMIRDGEHDAIGIEKLRGLLKILPEFDELEILKNFKGEEHRLGHAEKFLLELLKLPNYKLRIECMLLIEEFTVNLSYLKPNINAMLYAGEDLMTSKALQEIFFLVIVAGNFLNSGGYAGNAAGVKLQSLQKLTDIRANKPGMNLIHFVALQAEKRNKKLLHLADEMSNLEDASKTTIEQLNNEISTLETRISAIKKQVDLPTTENDIKLQMENFIKTAENELKMLQRGLKELEETRLQLADFFCEDPQQFKIEECYKIFYQFCEKFKLAVKENEKRKMLEEQANMRRKQREEQLANKRKQFRQYETAPTTLDNSFLMDPPSILYDIRFSPAMNRRRISPNINANDARDELVSPSPDITPNGSLRRRRSKVLSEEDEGGLMDFLRNSGHDSMTRERKSLSEYGSLDRSWAKRKQRPELLNVDFNLDRERPASPIDSRTLGQKQENSNNDQKPRISREWRLKIENWLHANEQDDKINEEYKRRMKRVSNRRALDNDAESEKLDTLVEEKEKYHLSPKSPVAIQPPTSIKIDVCDTVVSSGSVKLQHFSNNGNQIISPVEKSDENDKKQICSTPHLNDSRYMNINEPIHDNNSSKQLYHLSETNNKIEIDSDNIETPPTVRRNISALKLSKVNIKTDGTATNEVDEKTNEQENLGDGQFNRFASARRTRRYKRSIDLSHPTDEIVKSSSSSAIVPSSQTDDNILLCSNEKNTLPILKTESGHNSHNSSLNRNNSIDRSIRKIHREGAIKSSSPEEDDGITKKYSSSQIRSIPSNKLTSHELNDEGFEETQSLVSDTPSLTTSSCNDEGNKLMTAKEIPLNVKQSPVVSVTTTTALNRRPLMKASNQLQTLLTRNQQSLERSRSLRNTPSVYPRNGNSSSSTLSTTAAAAGVAPRRVNSMKKVEKESNVQKNAAPNKHLFAKRSNSRTSLISSISSLNSAVSTNTVKRMPTKFTSSSVSSTSSTVKKPVITISNSITTPRTSTRIPASRSSSSGSSIGPKPSAAKAIPPSSSSLKTRETLVGRNAKPNLRSSSSFMRPTTASASKSK